MLHPIRQPLTTTTQSKLPHFLRRPARLRQQSNAIAQLFPTLSQRLRPLRLEQRQLVGRHRCYGQWLSPGSTAAIELAVCECHSAESLFKDYDWGRRREEED